MAKKRRQARSIRGEIVDFDLFDIKNQMASQPKSTEVRAREDFIESRLRRRKSRLERNRKAQLEATTKIQEEEKVEAPTNMTEEHKEKVREAIKEVAKNEETKTRRIKKKRVEE